MATSNLLQIDEELSLQTPRCHQLAQAYRYGTFSHPIALIQTENAMIHFTVHNGERKPIFVHVDSGMFYVNGITYI